MGDGSSSITVFIITVFISSSLQLGALGCPLPLAGSDDTTHEFHCMGRFHNNDQWQGFYYHHQTPRPIATTTQSFATIHGQQADQHGMECRYTVFTTIKTKSTKSTTTTHYCVRSRCRRRHFVGYWHGGRVRCHGRHYRSHRKGPTTRRIGPGHQAVYHKKEEEDPQQHQNQQQVIFLPQGLSHVTGEIVFALPANPDHVSMRAVSIMGDTTTTNTNSTTRTVKAPVRTLRDFMTQLGHEYLDVLKMDIEGAEYDVLEGLMRENFMPFTQLLVEYHDRFLIKSEERSRLRHDRLLRGLKEAGFVELWSQNGGQERGYIKESDLQYCADGVSTRSATIR
jgi:FkbM family methyltransferase